MKNIFKYIFVAGFAAATLSSCDLDLLPNSAIVYEDGMDIITSSSDLQSLQNGLMASFRAVQRGTYWIAEDVMYDEFNAVSDYGNTYGQLHRLEQAIAGDYDIEDQWAGNYSVIKNYNIFIDAVPNMKSEDETLKAKAEVAKGYAHLFRASSYLQLARHFGKAYGPSASSDPCVPLILKFNINEVPARATVAEVYAAIKADLDEAAKLLANEAGAVNSQLPTIDAVNFMYARYYLDVKDNAKAAEYAEKVIGSAAGYKLASTAAEFAAEFTDDKGKENILQLYASEQETGNGMGTYTGLTNQTSQGHGYVYVYHPQFIPSKKVIDAYTADDLRLASWYTTDKRESFIEGNYYSEKFFVFIKWEGNPMLTTSRIPGATNATKPYTLPEAYLIAAEAYAQAGNSAKATEMLNALQTARKATLTSGDMANVKDEWLKETIGSGLRLSCLKRWGEGFGPREGQPGAVAAHILAEGDKFVGLSMAADDYHLVWPVPKYELQVNDNLEQNPGYESK